MFVLPAGYFRAKQNPCNDQAVTIARRSLKDSAAA